MTLKEIGQSLREARKAQGHTLQNVADALGMSIATISRLERGELDDIGARSLLRVTEYVGLQLVLRPAGFGMSLEDAMEDADRDFEEQHDGSRPHRP
jgi:transcriptional regulator with XRE-family HTH domain